MPAVSVIIPAYNQGHYLAEAIQSVLDQSYQDFELIVVDDGSTDQTRAVVEACTDPRLRYLYQHNQGLSAARNTGMRHATGRYLTFLDSDDLFLRHKLQLLVTRMEAEPHLGLVAGQAVPFDEQGEYLEKLYAAPLPRDGTQLLLGNPLHVGSVLMRRDWQERIGFFDETLRSYEDWDMWLRWARAGYAMGWVDKPVSRYRFHTAQMTGNGAQMTTATFAVLDKVFGDPSLPDSWKTRRAEAYANAHLRAAANAYLGQDFSLGKASLSSAIRLNPRLAEDGAALLAKRMDAWASSPKVVHRFNYLKDIYGHLPDELEPMLRMRRREALGQAAMQQALESYGRGDLAVTRSVILKAFLYHAGWLGNRGALSICLRSWLHILIPKRA